MTLAEMMQQLGMLIGGIGLFLLAVHMITDGLTFAAGDALRDLLASWTRSIGRGILAGLTFTAIVQSSSAVTVATIGFVNAGLLSLSQALGVVYGANIGTTMTGWLVAAVGFKIKVEAFALPMIGIGMLLQLSGARQRRGAIGQALAGFGLFFIGIDVLKGAFEGAAQSIDFYSLAPEGALATILFVGIGFLMTMLMQSSSAAIAIILTAATGGVFPLASAAAMVIGANIGTTSTAALAVIGATSNAKRVASAHIVFNFLTGLVALLIMPLMLWLVQEIGRTLHMEGHPAVVLAIFHTAFNVLGVLLLWPFTHPLTKFLNGRFVSQEEMASRPQYLDKNIVETSALAIQALHMELERTRGMLQALARKVLSWESIDRPRIEIESQSIDTLTIAVGDFVSRLERRSLPEDVTAMLPTVIRGAEYLNRSAELASEFSAKASVMGHVEDEKARQQLNDFRHVLIEVFEDGAEKEQDAIASFVAHKTEEIQSAYYTVKHEILVAGSNARLKISVMSLLLEEINRLKRMSEQYLKAMIDLGVLQSDELGKLVSEKLSAKGGEKGAEPVAHDLDGDGGEHQAEQPVEDVNPDRPK